jgi:hypothetical protein
VELVERGGAPPRTFTPRHRDMHRQVFQRARGGAHVEPYFEARDMLEPNVGGGFWDVPSADCYAGISARWYIDVWGDHNREASVASLLAALDFRAGELLVHPRFPNFLRTYGVTQVLSPFPQRGTLLPFAGRAGLAYVYRVEDSRRARFVDHARVVADDKEAVAALLAADFDPNREIVLHDAPPSPTARAASGETAGTARIVDEDQRRLEVNVTAPADGYLLLADTYYPGWTAMVDGAPAALYRANISVRGVPVPAGTHTVRFTYDPPGLVRGAQISIAAIAVLFLWTGVALYAARRTRR